MAILKSCARGRNTRTIYLSIPEKTSKADIDEFLEYLSEGNDYRVIYRDRKTPLSPIVKKEILEADEFGVAVTSALSDKDNRTLKEDLPFLNEHDREFSCWLIRPEDTQYRTYLNKALFPSSQITEEEKKRVSELLDKARQLGDRRKYKEAIRVLNEIKNTLDETGPESDTEQIHLVMRSFMTAASIILSSGQVTGAREEYRDAATCMGRLLTEENYPEVSQFLGEACANLLDFLLRDGEFEDALENCNEALADLNMKDHDLFTQEAHIMACQAIAFSGLGRKKEAFEVLEKLNKAIHGIPPFMATGCITSYITAMNIVNESTGRKAAPRKPSDEIEKLYEKGNQLFFNMQWSKAINAFIEADELIDEYGASGNTYDIMVDIHVKIAYACYRSRSRKNTAATLKIAYEDLKEYRSELPKYQDLDRILLCFHAALEYANNADLKKWFTLLDHAFTNLLKDTYLNDIPEDDRVWKTLDDARNQINDYIDN